MPYELIITGAVIFIIIIWITVSYNGLVKLKNKTEEAFSTMDVYLKKRYDLIPNIVKAVKGYAAYESSTLEKVIAARGAAISASDTQSKIEAEGALTASLRGVFALSENYPDLKANQSFLGLQSQLSEIEDDIANSRKYYNGTVRMLNNAVMVFPQNIVAFIFKFRKMPMFEIDTASRGNVEIQL